MLSIKRGEVPLAEVTDELTSKLDQLKELERVTTLPPYAESMQVDFNRWLSVWMRRFYSGAL